MTPIDFPEANRSFVAPSDMDEAQVGTIRAFVSQAEGGSCDGAPMVVVAHRLSPEEIEVIVQTGTVYLTMLGGLSPHYLSLSFYGATHPA